MGNAMGKSKCLKYVQILYTHVGAFYRSEQSTNTMVRNMITVPTMSSVLLGHAGTNNESPGNSGKHVLDVGRWTAHLLTALAKPIRE
jgi:hypothetical protein